MKRNASMKYRLLSLIAAVLLLAAALTACAETSDLPKDTLPPVSGEETVPEETRITADLPDLDLEGYTFTVAHWFAAGWECRANIDVWAEGFNGDPINDAVYSRNTRLTEKYDFEIDFQNVDHSELVDKVRQFTSTGDDVYDLVYLLLAETQGFTVDGSFLDFEADFDYVDLDKPYWDNYIRKELSFLGHTFLMASSYNVHDEDATAALAFNKQMALDLQTPNLYDIVRAGNWTFDALYGQMTSFDGDVNGDQVMKPEEDVYGFLGGNDTLATFYYGAGGRLTEKDEMDYPVFVFDTEDNYDLLSAVLDIMYDRSFMNHHMIGNENDVFFRQLFIDGHGLFYWMRMDDARAMRGEEAINFGILPVPKYDEVQKDHMSLLSRHTSGLMSVLRCEQNPDTVGFLMEAMAAASYYDLTNAYYEVTLKGKAARDDDSQDMLDIVFRHRVIDIADVFNFGGFADTLLNYPRSHPGQYNLASLYAENESKIDKAIEDFYEKIEKLDLYGG